MSFPRLRFLEAGATQQEADQLEQEFDALSPLLQEATAQRYAGIGQGDIAELIERSREEAGIEEEEPVAVDEPEPAGTDPAAAPAVVASASPAVEILGASAPLIPPSDPPA